MIIVTICSDFGAQENKVSLFQLFPRLFAMKWWNQLPWYSFFSCWVLSQLFTLLFHLYQEAFYFLCFLHRVVSSAYLRLLIFLLIILILACASFFLTLHMMYSTYKLNRRVVIYSLDVLLSQLGTTLNVCNFYLSTIPQESWGENTSYPALNQSLLL